MNDKTNKGICIRNAHLHPNLLTSIGDCEQKYSVHTNRLSSHQKGHRAPDRSKSGTGRHIMTIASTCALTPLNTLAIPCAKPLLWFALLARIRTGKMERRYAEAIHITDDDSVQLKVR